MLILIVTLIGGVLAFTRYLSFNKARLCAPYIEKLQKEVSQSDIIGIQSTTVTGCYSQKYNSCIAYIFEVSPTLTLYQLKDLFSNQILKTIIIPFPSSSRESYQDQQDFYKKLDEVDCSNGVRLAAPK